MSCRNRKNNINLFLKTTVIIVLFCIVLIILNFGHKVNSDEDEKLSNTVVLSAEEEEITDDNYISENAKEIIKKYADENGIDFGKYPDDIIELLERNPEAKEFVLEYPSEHNKKHKIDLSEYKDSTSVPLFIQWDKRWGYEKYGDDIIAINGCGPTCLSMAAVYLLNDTQMSPLYVADFAYKNGYQAEGNGSLWTLISEGGEKLGLDVTEIPLSKERIINNLEAGNLIICIMGPGDFTRKGHFILMTGYEDGKIRINDPNSYKNSEKKWEYEKIKDQIKNLWVISK